MAWKSCCCSPQTGFQAIRGGHVKFGFSELLWDVPPGEINRRDSNRRYLTKEWTYQQTATGFSEFDYTNAMSLKLTIDRLTGAVRIVSQAISHTDGGAQAFFSCKYPDHFHASLDIGIAQPFFGVTPSFSAALAPRPTLNITGEQEFTVSRTEAAFHAVQHLQGDPDTTITTDWTVRLADEYLHSDFVADVLNLTDNLDLGAAGRGLRGVAPNHLLETTYNRTAGEIGRWYFDWFFDFALVFETSPGDRPAWLGHWPAPQIQITGLDHPNPTSGIPGQHGVPYVGFSRHIIRAFVGTSACRQTRIETYGLEPSNARTTECAIVTPNLEAGRLGIDVLPVPIVELDEWRYRQQYEIYLYPNYRVVPGENCCAPINPLP